MFLPGPVRRELQTENEGLRAALEQAKASLAEFQRREHDLAEVLVQARAEARDLVENARVDARGLIERATEEARQQREAYRSEIEGAQRHLALLGEMQREVEASLQLSLASLAPVLALTTAAGARPAPAAADAPVPPAAAAPVPPADATPVPPAVPARVPPAVADSAPPPEMRPTGALDIFPHEVAARRPLERGRPTRAAAASPPVSRRWAVGLTGMRPVAAAVAAAAVVAAAVAWTSWGARGEPDQTETASMAPGAPLGESTQMPSEGTSREAAPSPAAPPRGAGTRAGSPLGRPPDHRSDLLTVAIEAVRPVWLRADADGRRELARTVAAGERLELRAREVTLRAGDAGAVLASVNGGAKAPLGPSGAVITRRIGGPTSTRAPMTAASTPRAEPLPAGAAARAAGPPTVAPARSPVRPTGAQPANLPAPLSPAPALTASAPLSSPPAAGTLLAPALPGASAEGAAQSSPLLPSEDEVLRAHEAYFDALRRSDQAAMRKVQAPTFTATGVPPPLGAGSLAVNNVSVQVSGVGAVVSGVASRRDTTGDGRALLFSELWTNTDGQWQLLSVRFVEQPRR